jgi:thiosulfate dehydrogenase [quinone] large subunit
MNTAAGSKSVLTAFIAKRVAAVRILFGIVWVVDAVLKYKPAFFHDHAVISYIKAVDMGMPSWLNPWFHFWFRVIGAQPTFFAFLVIVIETLVAISLLFGIARRLNYALSIPFCFLIWGVAENFGGPYVAGSTDIGAGFIYVVVFLLLYAVDGGTKPAWSLDPWIEKHISWWSKVANPPSRSKLTKNTAN